MRFLRMLLPLHLALAALAASAQPPVPTAAPAPQAVEQQHAQWWSSHRWRYLSDEAANVAFAELRIRRSPWPDWHQSHVVTLPVGRRFQMVIGPGQPQDRPGRFGTFDWIPDVEFARSSLGVRLEWKREIDRAVTYEVTMPLLADVGVVGPQIDEQSGRYLPGGASQFEMLVAPDQRMAHLRVVEVRQIR